MTTLATWDLTIKEERSAAEMEIWLRKIAKKWCFQLEAGEDTSYRHYQCRISLKTKKRQSTMNNILKSEGLKGHASPTSNNAKTNMFYVMKEETRVEGPWMDSETKQEIYIPRDILKIEELRPWQKSIMDSCHKREERKINILIDKIGGLGKTTLKRCLEAHGIAVEIPFSYYYKDLTQMVYDIGPKNCYIIDLPRSIINDNLSEFLGAIEEIKDGRAYNFRYKYQSLMFGCPVMWIFMCKVPNSWSIMQDKLVYWCVKRGELTKLENPYEVIVG